MIPIDQSPMRADYRLRLPRPVYYAIASGSAAVALGTGYCASAYRSLANLVTLIGATILVPVSALVGFVQIFQHARERLRAMLEEQVHWRGDEAVLDVGTGSGILLFACAKHLHSGTAIGIDIYDPNAGGGSSEIFWRNAHAEGVADRVELHNADARRMLFADASFNMVVSSLAMHHMGGAEDRQRATAEIMRVLKPGGMIVICDLTAVLSVCEQMLRQNVMINVQRHAYLGLFSILSAEKPHSTPTESIRARSILASASTTSEVS